MKGGGGLRRGGRGEIGEGKGGEEMKGGGGLRKSMRKKKRTPEICYRSAQNP